MPPGAVHHIIEKGIERRKIFFDDQDRNHFEERPDDLILETQTQCLAWALIPNHFHLLLRTGNGPIATFMCRQLTGYAFVCNRRHGRSGHLSTIHTAFKQRPTATHDRFLDPFYSDPESCVLKYKRVRSSEIRRQI